VAVLRTSILEKRKGDLLVKHWSLGRGSWFIEIATKSIRTGKKGNIKLLGGESSGITFAV
jgi:hypothetical protein